MIGTLIDVVTAAGIGTGAARGLKRQLSGQLARLAMLGVAVLIGCGAFQPVAGLLSSMLGLSGDSAGPLGFIGTFLVSWGGLGLIRRKVLKGGRSKLEDWLEGKIPDRADRLLGGAAGAAKGGLAMLLGVGAVSMVPLSGVQKAVGEESIAGRVVTSLLALHGEDPVESEPDAGL